MTMAWFLQEGADILAFVGRAFLHILPYLLVSIPLAVFLKRSGAADKIRHGLSANPWLAILMATLAGAISPFCSCGVVPIITALLLGGVPLAPVMSFWLASPSMDPEIFMLSVGSIGWELALWRLGATFVMSLGGGLLVMLLERRGWLGRDFLRPSIQGSKIAPSVPDPDPDFQVNPQAEALVACCAAGRSGIQDPFPVTTVFAASRTSCGCASAKHPSGEPQPSSCCKQGHRSGWMEDMLRTTVSLSLYMGVAFVLEALIIRYVPQAWIVTRLGAHSSWSVPLATLISIPMYTTNLTALGLVSGLLQQGMGQGAALAFLVGGAVTTLPAMSAVYGLVRARVFALYLGVCIAGSLLTGFAFQLFHTLR